MSDKKAPQKSAVALRLDFNWKIFLFALLLLPLLVSLGFWQLDRAEEKRTLQEIWERRQAMPALQGTESLATQQARFRRLELRGQFDQQRYWLLENQVSGGVVGYNVIVPFDMADGRTLLVNRGWLAGTGYRDTLPEVRMPQGEQIISGTLVEPSINPLLRQGVEQGGWPKLILQMDLDAMAEQLDEPLVGKVLQLDAASPGALAVNWAPMATSASKHLGYATQWFAMAVALVVLSIFANTNLGDWLKARRR